ncbi:MFS transporter [Nocardia carnea]|uniref:MFS transporter n=1 Tax=Nocardia carnea TaxID=37328 RepID=UPI002458B675|nr:MFS transporter [Nocardia carnea]
MITVVVALAFSYGLQMYCTVPAFSSIGEEFALSPSQTALMVSAFFLGYATFHIPAGFFSAAYGLKTVAVTGSIIMSASTVLFAVSTEYWTLLLSRVLGGMGMSAIVGSAIPLAVAWSSPTNVRMIVGGFINGLGATAGNAFGLYFWDYLTRWMSWRSSTLVAAAFGLLVTLLAIGVLRSPRGMADLDGGHFSWASTSRCLRSRSMWAIGIGSVGAYGALFTVSQLSPGYVETELGFSSPNASLVSTVMLLIGIPGALIGGYFADGARRYLPTLWLPAVMLAILLISIPFANSITVWIILAGVGFLGMMYFSPCTVSPGEYPDEIASRDFGTALGLVLTLGNCGSILFPYIYGRVTELSGPDTGWLVLGAAAALASSAFLLAREPRSSPAPGPDCIEAQANKKMNPSQHDRIA